MGLLFDALDVFFVAGVHLDEVTDVNEQRYANFNPRIGGGRLQSVSCRIAFDARFGVRDFGFDVGRQVATQHALLVRMKLQLANQPVLQKFRRIDDMDVLQLQGRLDTANEYLNNMIAKGCGPHLVLRHRQLV